MLAIAAPFFDQPSETFIRTHVRAIAPGRTVLLCQDAAGAEALDCPVLGALDLGIWPGDGPLPERIVAAVRRRWRRHIVSGLSGADRRRVMAFFATHRPAALLVEYGPTGVLFVDPCRAAGVPLFVHFHGYDASAFLRIRRWVKRYRLVFQSAAGIIAPSRFLAEKLVEIGCPRDKVHVSPCGVDASRFAATSRQPGRLVAVGRLVEKKAPHLTIEAFARIAGRFPEARLDMVGAGPLEHRCRDLVAEHGLEERVRLYGAQDHETVVRLMREAAIFVQHSVTAANGDTEGMPIAILEAMASALPVVSTRHSGIPEAVEHNVTGLLVEERDIDGMAAAMAELLDDPTRAAAMGVAGRARVLAHFTEDQTTERLRAIMRLSTAAPAMAASLR